MDKSMSELNSITVIFDAIGCEGWYARAEETITHGIWRGETQMRDIPLDCAVDADDEELADEARFEVEMDALLSCQVAEDFPVTVDRGTR